MYVTTTTPSQDLTNPIVIDEGAVDLVSGSGLVGAVIGAAVGIWVGSLGGVVGMVGLGIAGAEIGYKFGP